MSIVTIGDFKNYLQTVANAVSSGKMNVNDDEVKSVLQTIAAAVGEVSATPTANTLADRLKEIADRLGEASANPTANTALARLKALEGYLDGVEAALGAQADAEATGNGSLIAIVKRLRTILTDVWNDAANALNVQLTGRNVELIKLVDAQAITDTTERAVTLPDLSKYEDIDFIIASTLDADISFGFRSVSGIPVRVLTANGVPRAYLPGNLSDRFNHRLPWPGSQTSAPSFIPLSTAPTNIESVVKNPFKMFNTPEPMRLAYMAHTAPTSGSITIWLKGVPR